MMDRKLLARFYEGGTRSSNGSTFRHSRITDSDSFAAFVWIASGVYYMF